MRAYLRRGRANEVGDRSITGYRVVRIDRIEKARTIGRAYFEPLAANAERDLQTIIECKNLILSEQRERTLSIRRVVEGAERRRVRLKDRFALIFKPGRRQIMTAYLKIAAAVERVGCAIVDRDKGEI